MPTKTSKDSKGCYAQWGNKTKYYYKCGDSDARKRAIAKANKQGAAAHAGGYEGSLILQLQTFPASEIGLSNSGLKQFRKELIRVGKYVKDSTKQSFDITSAMLAHWVAEFAKWIKNGNKVPIPLGHEYADQPEKNVGWVTSLFIEGNSLFGILELIDPQLALLTDVSIAVPDEVIDGNGIKYRQPIVHVALTTQPVVTGLEGFEKMSLSLNEGDFNMKILKTIAKALGLEDEEPTEEMVLSAVEKITEKSTSTEDPLQKTDPVVKLVSENRALKLSNLVKAGLITPAIKDVITAKYVETKALALSMANKQEDGFDTLYDVLVQNHPSKLLDEISGVQSLELSNQSADKPNAMKKVVDKKRKDAGLDS